VVWTSAGGPLPLAGSSREFPQVGRVFRWSVLQVVLPTTAPWSSPQRGPVPIGEPAQGPPPRFLEVQPGRVGSSRKSAEWWVVVLTSLVAWSFEAMMPFWSGSAVRVSLGSPGPGERLRL